MAGQRRDRPRRRHRRLLDREVLIIADIVLTITVDQTFDSAVTLGLIVLVRTFLSFSLEIELEGTLPWRRGSTDKRPQPSASATDHDERSGRLGILGRGARCLPPGVGDAAQPQRLG
jgi:hypothetical protein